MLVKVESQNNHSEHRAILKTIGAIVQGSEKISQIGEREFVAIGEKLQHFSQLTRKLTDQSFAIGTTLSFGMSEEANLLTYHKEQIDEYIKKFTHQIDSGRVTLEDIARDLEQSSDQLSAFNKLVKTLSMLGIATKIESARMGAEDAGFRNIAETVEKLANVIKDKVKKTLDQTKQLNSLVMESDQKILKLEKAQITANTQIVARLGIELQGFVEHNDSCSASIQNLGASAEAIYKSIGKIVVAMQFHDITRQQVEHITHAFIDAQKAVEEIEKDPENGIHLLLFCRDLAKIQSAQLQNSRADFSNAIQGMIQNINEAGAQLSIIYKDTENMVLGGGDESGSFLTMLEKHLESMKANFLNSATEMSHLNDTFVNVGSTLTALSSFIEEIEGIGEEIELIALNAAVRAARSGKEGATLGVLAEEIQKLSANSRSDTGIAATLLKYIIKKADELQSNSNFYTQQGGDSELNQIIEGISEVLQRILNTSDELDGMLLQIKKGFSGVSQDMEVFAESITVHEDFESKSNDLVEQIQLLIEQLHETLGDRDLESSPESIERLKARYTMSREREIHDAVMDGGEGIDLFDTNDEKSDDSEFDDNIELF